MTCICLSGRNPIFPHMLQTLYLTFFRHIFRHSRASQLCWNLSIHPKFQLTSEKVLCVSWCSLCVKSVFACDSANVCKQLFIKKCMLVWKVYVCVQKVCKFKKRALVSTGACKIFACVRACVCLKLRTCEKWLCTQKLSFRNECVRCVITKKCAKIVCMYACVTSVSGHMKWVW